MESHFLLKHQMAKSVIMGFPIYLDFLAPRVAQEERKKLSTNALGYKHTHTHRSRERPG